VASSYWYAWSRIYECLVRDGKMILFISHHSTPTTGAHKRFDRLISRMADASEDVLWITPERKDNLENINLPRLIVRKGKLKSPVSLLMLFDVVKQAKFLLQFRGKIRNIHVFGETSLPAAIFAKLLTQSNLSIGVRSNFSKRALISRQKYTFWKKLIAYAHYLLWNVFLFISYRYAEQITVQTMSAKEEFCRHYHLSDQKVIVIPNDVPSANCGVKRSSPYPSKPIRLLYIGNESQIKGFDVLCSAIKDLDPSLTSIRSVTLIGVNALPKNFKTHPEISIVSVGWTEEIDEFLVSHDCLVVPSREDQFPNVVLEAFSREMPVIGSAVDGIKYMINDDALMFDPGSSKGLLASLYYVSSVAGYIHAKNVSKNRRALFSFDWEGEYLKLLNI